MTESIFHSETTDIQVLSGHLSCSLKNSISSLTSGLRQALTMSRLLNLLYLRVLRITRNRMVVSMIKSINVSPLTFHLCSVITRLALYHVEQLEHLSVINTHSKWSGLSPNYSVSNGSGPSLRVQVWVGTEPLTNWQPG